MTSRSPSGAFEPTDAATDGLFAVDRRNLMLCVLITLGAMLIAWPFAEGGVIDEFSYIHMAKTLAETGRFAYNGWPTAMLGIQVWWGAAWVWLFGFSFQIVRLSVWPLAVGAVALVYLLARRASLSPRDSLFAAMVTGSSARFLHLAPTFMTDVSSFCFLMASFYGFVRAVEAASEGDARPGRVYGWLAIGMLFGLLGGTIRQTVWFAPLAGAAVLFLWPAVGFRIRSAAFLCGVTGLLCIVVGIRWFNSQPYAIPTRAMSRMIMDPSEWIAMVRTIGWVLFGSASVLIPVIIYRFDAVRRWRRGQFGWLGESPGVDAVIMAALLLVVAPAAVVGVLETVVVFPGTKPALDHVVWLLRGLRIALMLLFALTAVGVMLRHREAIVASVRRAPAAILIPLVYLLPYSVAVMQASQTTGGLFDRYYLPCIPPLVGMVLYGTATAATPGIERRNVVWGWAFGWALLALCTAESVVRLHDMFAGCRARLAAIDYLESTGVARDRIMAGWQIDGWEQIERTGFMNDRRIRVPPDAYRPIRQNGFPEQLFNDRLSALTPEYIVGDDPVTFPGDGMTFPRFPWTAWRPPFEREVVIRHQSPTQASTTP